MILRATIDWDAIHMDLRMLQLDGMVVIQPSPLQFAITAKGLQKVQQIEMEPEAIEQALKTDRTR